ncbi:hypothetical protein BpHYR1_041126 [Brachionus plicatilis]|uniref:Uncharacterized protein n=1 Tax=Brachionus plicatilis TaxID=10195 RepID=A0A3M7S484_BRAPC|nr:hypothetical protein BpHYR1_041126 [Brachionus plicatilis]
MLTLTWSPIFSAPTTLVSSLNLIPCLVKIRWNCLATSAPPMLGRNSIHVTWEPRRLQTEPNSKPITPPPISTIDFGTCFKDRAPVELTMVSSSI